MLTIKDGVVMPDKDKTKHPYDIAAMSDEILPSGCSISTSIFVIDKIAVCFCDGNDNWYRQAGKPVPAGQPISALF